MIVSSGYRKNGFDAYGGAFLCKSDMAYWMDRKERTDPEGVALELGEDVKEVERGFFEILPTLDALWILNPKCTVSLTEGERAMFRKNNVLIRGVYDASAEQFAKKEHLRFLHLDVKLAAVGDYFERGKDIITLRFRGDGSAYIHQDCRCQGSSAGSTGGGEVSFDLPKDFYLTMQAEDIAEKCWGSCYAEILRRGTLAAFIAKAGQKQGFLLDYTGA